MSAAPRSDLAFIFYENESFNGAIARWADSAWIERMMDVTSVAGVTWGHRQTASNASEDHLRLLAQELGVDPAELIKRAVPKLIDRAGGSGTVRFNGLELSTTLVERQVRRVSPRALALAPYHRALWDLRFLPFCTETGTLLTQRCGQSDCSGKPLGWQHTLGIDRCEHCMTDLKSLKTSQVASDLHQALRPIAQLFIPETRQAVLATLPERLRANGGQIAADLLIRLIPIADPSLRPFLKSLHHADPFVLARALANAWALLENWPNRFKDFAIQKLNKREKHHDDGNMGETTRFLRNNTRHKAPVSLLPIIQNLLAGIDVSGVHGKAILTQTLQIKIAAKKLGLGTAEVAALRRSGTLRTVLILDEQGRLQPVFDRTEIDRLRRDMAQRNGVNSIAYDLGIAQNGVEQMVDEKLLEVLLHPFFLSRYGIPQVTQDSYDAFRRKLARASHAKLGSHTLSCWTAMKIVGGRLKPWGPFFTALSTGSISFHIQPGTTPLTRRLMIGVDELIKIEKLSFEAPSELSFLPATTMSKADAMELLNMSPKEGTRLFSHLPTSKGDKCKPVTFKSALRLAEDHITSAELSLRRNVSLRKAYVDALQAGVPHLGLAGFCRPSADAKFFAR